MHVDQRHTARTADLGRPGLCWVAIELLCRMQSRQQRGTALARQFRAHPAQANEIGVSHRVLCTRSHGARFRGSRYHTGAQLQGWPAIDAKTGDSARGRPEDATIVTPGVFAP